MRLGFHMPLKGGAAGQLNRAHKIGMEAVQIFSGNPTSWKPGKIDPQDRDRFLAKQAELDIRPLVFHTPYLINLASPKDDIYEKSLKLLYASLEKAHMYQAPYVVTHVGSHTGSGREKGISRVKKAIERLYKHWPGQVKLLLENTSGSGSNLGADFKDIKAIMKELTTKGRLACCFDTAHAWGAGYKISNLVDVEKTLDEWEQNIGLEHIKICHANDTDVELGSTKDRHQHIGEGKIGLEGFASLLTHRAFVPEAVILETPKMGTEYDQINLDNLKKAVGRNETGISTDS